MILQLRDGTRLFYGLQRQLLEVAYKQDFDALLDLRWKPSLAAESLTGWAFTGEGETNEQDQGRIGSKRKKPWVQIAALHTNSSGRVFGIVGPEQAIKSSMPP